MAHCRLFLSILGQRGRFGAQAVSGEDLQASRVAVEAPQKQDLGLVSERHLGSLTLICGTWYEDRKPPTLWR